MEEGNFKSLSPSEPSTCEEKNDKTHHCDIHLICEDMSRTGNRGGRAV